MFHPKDKCSTSSKSLPKKDDESSQIANMPCGARCDGCDNPSAHNVYGTEWCSQCFSDKLTSTVEVLSEYGMSVLVSNKLINCGILTVGALCKWTRPELLKITNISGKRADQILTAMRLFWSGAEPVNELRAGVEQRKADIDRRLEDEPRQRLARPNGCEPKTTLRGLARDTLSRPHNMPIYSIRGNLIE